MVGTRILIYLAAAAVLAMYLLVKDLVDPQVALIGFVGYSTLIGLGYYAGRKDASSNQLAFRAILFPQLVAALSKEDFLAALRSCREIRLYSTERDILVTRIGSIFDLTPTQQERVRAVSFAPFKKGDITEYDKAELRRAIPDEAKLKDLIVILNILRRMS